MQLTIISRPDCPYCRALFDILARYRLRQGIQIRYLQEDSEEAQRYDYYYLPAVFLEDRRILHGTLEEASLQEVLKQITISEV